MEGLVLQLLHQSPGGGTPKLSEAAWEARAVAVFSEAAAGAASSTVDIVKLYNLLANRRGVLRRGQFVQGLQIYARAHALVEAEPPAQQAQQGRRDCRRRKQLAYLGQLLAEFTVGNNGRMTSREFQAFLQRGGGRLAHLANSLFHTVDSAQQGALSLQDILRVLHPRAGTADLAAMAAAMQARKRRRHQENDYEKQFAEMRDIFVAYDIEHSGELNRARFTEAFMAAGYDAEGAGDMFDRIDLDHGGTVSLDEFAAWWLSDSHKAGSSAAGGSGSAGVPVSSTAAAIG
ncbi:hypothetical protein WJX81_005379 [Elliptochloris bilobata]|uniref:EF-hand domain-containing protein n=1 Tax=Elliptochloris bilobata TaxID=381761 RepID=A0AAW1SI01_9CHLO